MRRTRKNEDARWEMKWESDEMEGGEVTGVMGEVSGVRSEGDERVGARELS